MLELSRGCWIGAEKPCAFCGANGLYRKQRVKNPAKAYREITELAERYGVTSIAMTDNAINPIHFEQLLPRFEGTGMRFTFQSPVTLTREQMRNLSEAGVWNMQPGIEQLHDGLLASLGKHNKAFHNIRFLKWAREFGINVTWNCLYEFPEDNDKWYNEAANLVPLLTHLQPPTCSSQVRFDRFSLYFNEQERYGIKPKPMQPYYHIFPLDEEALSRLAYHFDRIVVETGMVTSKQNPGLERLLQRVSEWRQLFPAVFDNDGTEPPILAMTLDESGILSIEDTRPAAVARRFSYSGAEAAIYTVADKGSTAEEITIALTKHFPGLLTHDIEDILKGFVTSRLMLNLDGIYLALAVTAPFRNYVFARNHKE
jgi:magnesium-protoporphyrin IX monomethyl ester (oxidative) cyclase